MPPEHTGDFMSPNLEAAIGLHEGFKTFQEAGFTEQQALYLTCWMAFGPRFEVPVDDLTP